MRTSRHACGAWRNGRAERAADVSLFPLEPRTARESEILARADLLPGRSLGELSDAPVTGEASSAANKGAAGAVIERWFGITANSEQAPDFEAAGIELKVCPLVMDDTRPRRIKERTSVTMIDFMQLDTETWATASVRPKLERVLFVFYEWRPDVPVRDFRVRAVRLWSPPEWMQPYLERDWHAVWTKNHEGRAHQISEGDGALLGAATKGATGATRPQPHSTEVAASRAWSLKPKLTWTIFEATQGAANADHLLAELRASDPLDLVDLLLARLDRFVGRTVREVAAAIGFEPSEASRDRAAQVIRRAMGIPARGLPASLTALGLEIRTVPVDDGAMPYEATAFPAFDHRELVGEEWQDSDLLAHVQHLIFVPLHRERREVELLDQRLCRPVQWSPDQEALRAMRLEWERYRDLVASGGADRLPTEAETSCVHVRTKGRDARDVVEAPGGLRVARKAFYLNREFVREIVLSSHSDWRGF